MKRFILFAILFCFSTSGYSQMKRWVLGNGMRDEFGNLNTARAAQLKFFEVNFSTPTPTFSIRQLGNSVKRIVSAGVNEGMTSATDAQGNIAFYSFPGVITPYASTQDTTYLVAYSKVTGMDEVFATIPPESVCGNSVKETEIIKKDGTVNQYYFIYKTACINNNVNDRWLYRVVDLDTRTISTATAMLSGSLNEGMAVSRYNCVQKNRWLFFVKYINGNLELYRSSITGASISTPILIKTLIIPGNSSLGQGDIEISPMSDKIAIANYTSTNIKQDIAILNLDLSSGNVSNLRWIDNPGNYMIALEFSPDGNRLYSFRGGTSAITSEMYNIPVPAVADYTITTADLIHIPITASHSIEAGYDGILYFTNSFYNTSLNFISNPNEPAAANILGTTLSNSFGIGNNVGYALPDQVDGEMTEEKGISVFPHDTTICEGDSITLKATGADTYIWSGGINSTKSTEMVKPTTTTTYYLQATATCGQLKDTITITIHKVPAFITGDQSICIGEKTTLTANGGNSYQWFGGTNSKTPSMVVSPKVTTTYDVVAYDGSCYSKKIAATVVVNANPNVAIDGQDTICASYPTKYGTIIKGGSSPYLFLWSTGSTQATTSFSSSTSTQLGVLIIDNNGCRDSTKLNILVATRPDAILNGKFSGCSPVNVSFKNQSEYASTYKWIFGDGTTSTLKEPAHTYTNQGNYTVTLIAQNGFCADTTVIKNCVSVLTTPIASISYTDNNNKQFSIYNSSKSGNDCIIYFGDGDSLKGCDWNTILHVYKEEGEYTLTQIATNANGCSDTVRVTILVEMEGTLFYPNSFTPDGDGLNDVFYLVGSNIKQFDLKVYNRWGQLLFQSNDINKGWDGTFKGLPVEQDVYVFKVDYRGAKQGNKQIYGHINVVK